MTAGVRALERPALSDPHKPFTFAQKAALAAEIATSYIRVKVWLHRLSLEEAIVAARGGRAPLARTESRPNAEYHLGRRLGMVVERRLGHLPGDTRCLTRSLVLIRMLALRGIVARLVIGARLEDEFTAHAWVELDEYPLLDPQLYASGRLTAL